MGIESLLEHILDELKKIHEKLSCKEPKAALKDGKRFLTVKQFTSEHPWPNEGGMRHIIFNQKPFKAQSCFKKVGRRVLVDEEEFFKWLQSYPKFKIQIEEQCRYSNK